MEPKLTRIRVYGDRIAKAQDALLRAPSSAIAAARARWVAFDETSVPVLLETRRWRAWSLLAVMTVVFGAFAAHALWRPARAPVTFDVGPPEASASQEGIVIPRGIVGEWIASPAGAALPIRFSDGSVVRLQPASRARVVEVAATGASVVLERGATHVSVTHRGDTRWNVRAGPFDVRITGTTFQVAWDPIRELFTIALEQGTVTVSGCSLPHDRSIRSGETFRAVCHDGQVVPPDGSGPAPSGRIGPVSDKPIPVGPSTPPPPSSLPRSVESAPHPEVASPVHAPPSSRWVDLIAMGRYADAIDAAQTEGLANVCATANVQALMSLGDAARFGGRSDEADFILQRLRQRFPDDERASVAAFDLGRIAFDMRRSYSDAVRWFDVYLDERPSGPLAREASGRSIEALERSGSHERAREVAKRYLQMFPNGPHADLARSITEGE